MRFSELIRRITAGTGEGSAEVIHVAGDPEIRRICEDSRKVEAGDLFVARGGTKTNGGQFAVEAVGKGAVAVVMDGRGEPRDMIPGLEGGKIAFARVENGNRAAALLALALAGDPTKNMKLIAVTGTKGKTTVAYLMRSVLKAAGFKVGMIGTVEIDDGKNITPAEMTTPSAVDLAAFFSAMQKNGVTHCVMEVSSHALHQQRTAGLDFAVGIFTNLTGDHLDYHKTMEEYAAAKARLFEGLKEGAVAVVNEDDKWVGRMVQGCKAKVVKYRLGKENVEHYLFHGKEAGECLGSVIDMTGQGMTLWVWGADGFDHRMKTPLVGRHNARNVLSVVAAAESMGIESFTWLDGLQECSARPEDCRR